MLSWLCIMTSEGRAGYSRAQTASVDVAVRAPTVVEVVMSVGCNTCGPYDVHCSCSRWQGGIRGSGALFFYNDAPHRLGMTGVY